MLYYPKINGFNKGDALPKDRGEWSEYWENHACFYVRGIHKVAFDILGNREDAEEVTQDVVRRVYGSIVRFRGDSELFTWLFPIVRNLARNRYRDNKVRGAGKHDFIDEKEWVEVEDRGPTPSEEVAAKEFERNVLRELDKLPSLYREALVLRNVEGLSYCDIASLLEINLGAVRSRISRAREKMRENFGLVE